MYTAYLARIIRRRKIVITVSIALIFFIVFISRDSNYSLDYFYERASLEDVSCHYASDNDALTIIDKQFFPSPNSIFFHETSCRGRLNSRQACAIESAARTHPDWEIHVLFSAPVNKLSLSDVNIELLTLMKNVLFSRVHIVDYANGTPLEVLVSGGALNRTFWPITYTADVLRYITLYKWGGIVLDLDTIVTKPFFGLGSNWAIKQNGEFVRSEALAFHRDSVGTLVADAAARILARKFSTVWGQYQGSQVITKALKEICSTEDVTEMTAEECLDFEVHPPSALLSLDPGNPEDSYKEIDYNSTDIYIYQVTSQPLHDHKVNYKGSLYATFAKRYCPIVYETYRDLFGI